MHFNYKKTSKLIYCLTILSVLILSSTSYTHAQSYTLLEPLPCIDTRTVNSDTGEVNPNPAVTCISNTGELSTIDKIDLGSFFAYMFNLLIAISAAAAILMMVYGGFQYMTTDSWSGKGEGLTRFKNAIYGLLMVLSAFLILKTVNPSLVSLPAAIQPIKLCNYGQQRTESNPCIERSDPNDLLNNVDSEAQNAFLEGKAKVDALKKQLAEATDPIIIEGLKDKIAEEQSKKILINAVQMYDNQVLAATRQVTYYGSDSSLERLGLFFGRGPSLSALLSQIDFVHQKNKEQLKDNTYSLTPQNLVTIEDQYNSARGKIQLVQEFSNVTTNYLSIMAKSNGKINMESIIKDVSQKISNLEIKKEFQDWGSQQMRNAGL